MVWIDQGEAQVRVVQHSTKVTLSKVQLTTPGITRLILSTNSATAATQIAPWAFLHPNNTYLKYLALNVTVIGGEGVNNLSIFKGCDCLSYLQLEANLSHIDTSAIAHLGSLKAIIVNTEKDAVINTIRQKLSGDTQGIRGKIIKLADFNYALRRQQEVIDSVMVVPPLRLIATAAQRYQQEVYQVLQEIMAEIPLPVLTGDHTNDTNAWASYTDQLQQVVERHQTVIDCYRVPRDLLFVEKGPIATRMLQLLELIPRHQAECLLYPLIEASLHQPISEAMLIAQLNDQGNKLYRSLVSFEASAKRRTGFFDEAPKKWASAIKDILSASRRQACVGAIAQV